MVYGSSSLLQDLVVAIFFHYLKIFNCCFSLIACPLLKWKERKWKFRKVNILYSNFMEKESINEAEVGLFIVFKSLFISAFKARKDYLFFHNI